MTDVIRKTIGDGHTGRPYLIDTMERLVAECRGKTLPAELERHVALGAHLAGLLGPIEFFLDEFTPNADLPFSLVCVPSGSADLNIPLDPLASVTCNQSGIPLGKLSDIRAMGAWLHTELNRQHAARVA